MKALDELCEMVRRLDGERSDLTVRLCALANDVAGWESGRWPFEDTDGGFGPYWLREMIMKRVWTLEAICQAKGYPDMASELVAMESYFLALLEP